MIMDSIIEARKAMQMPPMRGIGHAGRNGSREYKYATLQDVLACVVPPLLERGVMLTQGFDDGMLVTRAVAGEEVVVLDARPVSLSGSPQEQGSAETYAKRYALCTAFCLAGTEDDDGAAASAAPQPPTLAAAKMRLWNAIKQYADVFGADPAEISARESSDPEWREEAGYISQRAAHYEELCNGCV